MVARRLLRYVLAKRTEEHVQLVDRAPARRLDRCQLLGGLLGLGREDAPRSAGLDTHQADVVGDDVVELSRDPDALVANRATLAFEPLAFELVGALVELALVASALGEPVTGEPGRGDEEHVVRERRE